MDLGEKLPLPSPPLPSPGLGLRTPTAQRWSPSSHLAQNVPLQCVAFVGGETPAAIITR